MLARVQCLLALIPAATPREGHGRVPAEHAQNLTRGGLR
jgi:hypothetical protein